MNKNKRWTDEEDARLLKQINAFPQNLSKCFNIVSEVTGRSPGACAARWYTVLSKREDVHLFFTASEKHISVNRKNGVGRKNTKSIWRRLLRLLGL